MDQSLDFPERVMSLLTDDNSVKSEDLIDKILEITKSKSEVQFLPYSELKKRGFEDIQRRLPDISKIENLTSWKPLKGLDEILHDYHRFLMN